MTKQTASEELFNLVELIYGKQGLKFSKLLLKYKEQAKQEGKQELWEDLRNMRKAFEDKGISPISPDIETMLWKPEVEWIKKRHNLK